MLEFSKIILKSRFEDYLMNESTFEDLKIRDINGNNLLTQLGNRRLFDHVKILLETKCDFEIVNNVNNNNENILFYILENDSIFKYFIESHWMSIQLINQTSNLGFNILNCAIDLKNDSFKMILESEYCNNTLLFNDKLFCPLFHLLCKNVDQFKLFTESKFFHKSFLNNGDANYFEYACNKNPECVKFLLQSNFFDDTLITNIALFLSIKNCPQSFEYILNYPKLKLNHLLIKDTGLDILTFAAKENFESLKIFHKSKWNPYFSVFNQTALFDTILIDETFKYLWLKESKHLNDEIKATIFKIACCSNQNLAKFIFMNSKGSRSLIRSKFESETTLMLTIKFSTNIQLLKMLLDSVWMDKETLNFCNYLDQNCLLYTLDNCHEFTTHIINHVNFDINMYSHNVIKQIFNYPLLELNVLKMLCLKISYKNLFIYFTNSIILNNNVKIILQDKDLKIIEPLKRVVLDKITDNQYLTDFDKHILSEMKLPNLIDQECRICLINKVNFVFPCGHMVCHECCFEIDKCHKCSKLITNRQILYG
jgi:hypothetical protein